MLEGKIALVTGAAKGIGRAIALALAADGATVIVNYNGSAQKAEAVVDEIKALGKDSEAYQCNVANTADVDAMIKDVIKRYGSLDILVNNAGITRDNLIMKMSEEDFDAVIDANLKGCFNTIKAVSRQMLKQRAGRIINITSVSGILGNAGQANYAASKAGIIGLTKTMAPRDSITMDEYELEKPASDVHDYYRNFCAAIDGKATQLVTHPQMRRVMKVMEACFESDKCGQVIPFNE